MNININEWKKFRFGDLISDIYKAKAYAKEELEFSKYGNVFGTIPYVTRTEPNNSIEGFVFDSEFEGLEKGNALVVGDTTSTISYQPDDFIAGDHIVVIRAEWLNYYTGIFMITILNQERFRYSYGRAYLKGLIENTEVKLPVIGDKPDWKYIEKYIKKLNYKMISTGNKVKNNSIDTSNWELFNLAELFDIGAGNYHYSNEYEGGNTPYITATNNNNGINERISLMPEFKKNVITTEKVNCCAFYQPEDFCATSDVNILNPKFKMNKYIALFICTVINFDENYRWNYGRQCRVGDTKKINIKLPAKKNDKGEVIPDFCFMEDYIKSLPYGDRI